MLKNNHAESGKKLMLFKSSAAEYNLIHGIVQMRDYKARTRVKGRENTIPKIKFLSRQKTSIDNEPSTNWEHEWVIHILNNSQLPEQTTLLHYVRLLDTLWY